MKKSFFYVFILLAFILSMLFLFHKPNEKVSTMSINSNMYNATIKRDLLCLMIAYPKYVADIKNDKNGNITIISNLGRRLLYDDKRVKSITAKLNNPDIQDMMEQIYPLNNITTIMPEGFDPGRIRIYPLLKEVYGTNKKQITPNLTTVRSKYQSYQFNSNNNAAKALKDSMGKLDNLIEIHPELQSFIYPSSGTFNYRLISGTGRLSSHSFGITIDLARDKRDYWQWVSKKEGQKRLNSYPREIVHTFEENNFIWGGKWSHFDILHFEYRPEIIIKAKYFSNTVSSNEPWYLGAPLNDPNIKNIIEFIDAKIK